MHHRQDLKMKEELAHLQLSGGRSDFEPWNFNLVVEIIRNSRLVGGFTSEVEQTSLS